LFYAIAESLTLHEIARVNENITFTYSNNETNESVWPGKSVTFKIAIYSSNYVLSTL